jgi:hypothetical protein
MMVPERGLTGTTVPANFPVARLCITWKPNLSGFSEAPITATVLGEKSHLRLSNNRESTMVRGLCSIHPASCTALVLCHKQASHKKAKSQNPKSEFRNSKQIRISNVPMTETKK